MRRTRMIMGLPIIIDIPGAESGKPFEIAFNRLEEIDQQFSPYIKTSELNRYNRGEIEASRDMKLIISACHRAEKMTKGYFTAWYGKNFEPSGYVKGWAISESGQVLNAQKVGDYCVFAGGDILAVGAKIWKVGIQDPLNKNQTIAIIKLKNAAIATSGNYERGEHITNPKTGRPAVYWSSFTVIGPDIIIADVLATAGFAAGPNGLRLVEKQTGYEALAINNQGQAKMTASFAKYLA